MENRTHILKIKTRLLEQQLTIKELAHSFNGVASYQRVARILRGDAIATKKERALFAKALRCAQRDLFGTKENVEC